MRRKFDRDAARVADPVAHALGEFEVMAIAGCQIAAGLGDADDRPPRLQFVDAETIVQIAFEIERSEEHTSELQSLMRISYAVFCLKKKKVMQKYYVYDLTKTHIDYRTKHKSCIVPDISSGDP